jgi:predicted ABC-type ATPase
MAKTIYVVGGTNGVGKSTIREELLGPSIPYINADFIAQQLKVQHASLMLAELARQYGSEQIKKYIEQINLLLSKITCMRPKRSNGWKKCRNQVIG